MGISSGWVSPNTASQRSLLINRKGNNNELKEEKKEKWMQTKSMRVPQRQQQQQQHDDNDGCSSCNDDDDQGGPLQKKPKTWAHHLLAIVSPERQTPSEESSFCHAHDDDENNNYNNHTTNISTTVASASQRQQQLQHKQQAIVFVNDPSLFVTTMFVKEDIQLVVWRRPQLPRFVQTLSRTTLHQNKLPSFYGIVTPDNCVALMTQKLVQEATHPNQQYHQPNPHCHQTQQQQRDDEENGTVVLSRSELQELIADVHRLVTIFHSIVARKEPEDKKNNDNYKNDNDNDDDDDDDDDDKEEEEEEEEEVGVHVRLERLDNNGCQFWHQDTVPLRLVATYRGPCTEYVDPKHKDETLNHRTEDSPHARSLTHYDVALFKGRMFDDDEDDVDVDIDDVDDVYVDKGDKEVVLDDVGDVDVDKGDKEVDLDEDIDDHVVDLTSPGIVHRSPKIEGSDVVRLVLVLDIPADFHNNNSSDDDDDDGDDDDDNDE